MLAVKRSSKILVILLFASISAAPAGTAREDLATASSTWKSAGLEDYDYTVQDSPSLVQTGCHDELPAKLTVHRGKVTRGFYLKTTNGQSTRARIPESCLTRFYTIDSLFAYIANRIGDCQRLKVTYDARYGYPTSVEDGCILDGEFPVMIWDVTPGRQ
jgi:hypothetical protein